MAAKDAKDTSKQSPDSDGGTVLVPPDGVHTPGTTAHGEGQPLVAAPADADDHEAAAKAYKAAQEGDFAAMGPAELANQHADGSAMTPGEHAAAVQAEKDQEKRLGDPTAKPDGVTK